MGTSAILSNRSPSVSSHSITSSQSSTRSHSSRPRRRARSSSPLTSMSTGKPPPSPRTMEKYARIFDHALAQRYVAALRARARAVGVSDNVPLPVLIAHADQAHGGKSENRHNAFIPRMDMYECPAGPSRRVTATLELPGMKREALRLEVQDHTLIIEGSRTPPSHSHPRSRESVSPPLLLTGPGVPPPSKADLERYSQAKQARSCQAAVSELRYGRFRRVLTLPSHVEASDIEANMEDGMLHVSWPV